MLPWKGAVILPVLILATVIISAAEGKRERGKSKPKASAVMGYKTEKPGPTTLESPPKSEDRSRADEGRATSREFSPMDFDKSKGITPPKMIPYVDDPDELAAELERSHPNDVTTMDGDLDFDLDDSAAWSRGENADPDFDLDDYEDGTSYNDLYRGQQELLGLVVSLTEHIQSLQHTVTNIKLQNHYIYRTMKRNYRRCKEASTPDTSDNSGAVGHSIHAAAQRMPEPECPRGFVENPNTNTCYQFNVDRISWRMARERCRVDDSDLVTIETKGEQRWLAQQARHSQDTRHCDFWTGASDRKAEGDWRWIANNNALSYSNWNVNEPNNGRSGEHCAQMLWIFNWAWNDAHCDYHNACYICETGKVIPGHQ